MVGIYCIRNVIDNKRYIGQSVRMQLREYEHFESLRKGTHFNSHLQYAYNLYGSDSFVFEILEKCSIDMLSDREIYWISFFGGYASDDLYNLIPGGKSNVGECNPRYGKHWSEEWKTNQSTRMKEYLSDPTHHPMYGKHFSEESRAKMSRSRLGKTRTAQAKQRTSDTLKRKYASGELVAGMRGRHHSEATKEKLRNRTLPKHTPEQLQKMSEAQRGAKNPMYGKTHTMEARAKLSASHLGDKNYAYGKVRITDGVVNKFWPKDTPLPPGYRLGMRPRQHNADVSDGI